mmetsp:Transcript_60910/g.176155  ORF Transcript_60910/g.176155 Transcript_60910/m.176155 type:complete len:346 (+) Transcript_60910:770-1807(+)
MQHAVVLAVQEDLEGLEAVGPERHQEAMLAVSVEEHLLGLELVPRADDEIAPNWSATRIQHPAAARPEGEHLPVQAGLLHMHLVAVGVTPDDAMDDGAANASGREAVENAAPLVWNGLAVEQHGAVPELDVGVQCLQVHTWDVVRVGDVEEHLEQGGHAASLALGADVRLHSAEDQGLLIAALHASEHLGERRHLNAIVQQAPAAMAIDAVHVPRIDASVADRVGDALLLGRPVWGGHACPAAIADHAPTVDATYAWLVWNNELVVHLLGMGLQTCASAHLATDITVAGSVEGEASAVGVHEGVEPGPQERRERKVHAADDGRGAVAATLHPPHVRGRHRRGPHR